MNGPLIRTLLVQIRETFLKATMHACALFEIEGRFGTYVQRRRRITIDLVKSPIHGKSPQRVMA